MEALLQDLRYGIRVLIKSRGFTAAAIIALVLGIGANTAIFSVVNAVLLRPLPYPEPDRLVQISETSPQFDQMSVSYLNFVDWREQCRSFEAMAVFRNDGFNLASGDSAERVRGRYVSAGFFTLVGIPPSQGRDFTTEDDRPGASAVAIITHELWQRRFGGEENFVGKTISLNGKGYTVIGILPPGFRFYSYSDVYLPFSEMPEMALTTRELRMGTQVIARLKPGVSLHEARDEMSAVAASLAERYPDANGGSGATITPMYDNLVGGARKPLVVLLIAVGFVLLIACANVANLMLARSAARQKEMAIRIALGATRQRIIRQLLSESLLLAIIGGGLGLLLSLWGVDVLINALSGAIPRVESIRVDGAVLLFTLAISLATGLIFGLIPALQASKPDLHESIKEGGRVSTGGRQRVRNLLVVAEIALALVLLVGAGLMIRTLAAIYNVRPGFDPEGVVTLQVALSEHNYTEAEKVRDFFRQLLDRLKTMPGIEASAVTTNLPFDDDSEAPFFVEGRPMPSREEMPWAMFYAVSPQYLDTMKVPLLKGRFINEQDTERSRKVLVIDDTLASGIFPNEEAIGKRLVIPLDIGEWEIVGIVGHVKHTGLIEDTNFKVPYQFYMPFLQIPDQFMSLIGGGTLLLRTDLAPKTVASEVERQVLAIDKGQPVYSARSMEEIMANSLGQRRLSMLLLGIFAAVALLLAAVGIYGVMSYSVAQRTHEIGIRMALGASSGDVLRLVVGQGMMLAIAGVMIGIVIAAASTHLMASLLFGVEAIDPVTFAAVSLGLLGVALAACFVPARRATKVDPMIALRYE